MVTVYAIDVETMQLTFAFTLASILTIIVLIEEHEGSKAVILQYLSGALWVVNGLLQFIVDSPPSGLTFGMSYLFFGFAFLFILSALYGSFGLLKEKRGKQV